MTAIEADKATAATEITPPCEAFLPQHGFLPRHEQIPCGAQPTRRVRVGCIHEHIKERWACSYCDHLHPEKNPYCGDCWEADGHICDVIITAVTP